MPSSVPRPEPPADLAYDVIQLLVAMSGRLSQHFSARAAEFGLSAVEGKVLLALEPERIVSMRALARSLGYDASNLTGIIDSLEEKGAVDRRVDSADRRVRTIATTRHGQQLREEFGRRLGADDSPVAALSRSQLTQLRGLLLVATKDPLAEP